MGLKDVAEQRDKLFRKLEALKEKGIILAPNMTVLKSDPSSSGVHSDRADTTSPGSDLHHHQQQQQQQSKLRQLSSQAAAAGASTKRSSSMNRMDQQLAPAAANSVATGGSLKKDSFAGGFTVSSFSWLTYLTEDAWRVNQ